MAWDTGEAQRSQGGVDAGNATMHAAHARAAWGMAWGFGWSASWASEIYRAGMTAQRALQRAGGGLGPRGVGQSHNDTPGASLAVCTAQATNPYFETSSQI